jgi:DNA (cytosine-5)-methyltransferase 1
VIPAQGAPGASLTGRTAATQAALPVAVPVLDIFAGAGGLSIGLEQAGFTVAAAAEWDRDACETYAGAHPRADLLEGDVTAMSFRSWRGEVEVLAGGPPCQPWSTGGKRLGAGDPRNGWPAFIRALREIRPRAFLAENVAGLAAASRRGHLQALLGELAGLGFGVSWAIVNAADHGVAQKRSRLLIVGIRGGRFEFPVPRFGPLAARPWRRAGELLGAEPVGTANPATVTFARHPDLRPSPYDGHVFNGGGRPIDLGRPAPTLLASMGGNKTPWVDVAGVVPAYHAHLLAGGPPQTGPVPGARRITVEEAALLQSFPPGLRVAGKRSSRYRQVGNAVPPLLAQAVGTQLRSLLG